MSRKFGVLLDDGKLRESSFEEQGIDRTGHDRSPLAGLMRSSMLDLADLAGALIWLLGCVFFLPSPAADPVVYLRGCILFIVGEWIYMAVYFILFRDATAASGPGVLSLASIEAVMGLVGSTCFFLGTLLFLPDDLDVPAWILAAVDGLRHISQRPSTLLDLPGELHPLVTDAGPYFFGTVLYVVGSIGFSFSSFACAMGLRSCETLAERLTAISAALHMFGGIMFCIGSMGFIDKVGCNDRMVALGAWCFIIGCVAFASGAVVALARDHAVYRDELGCARSLSSSDSESD